MSGRYGSRSAGTFMLSLVLAASAIGAPPVAARGPAMGRVPARGRTVDLAAGLGDDGTCRGAAGVAGTVDAGAWDLVSDLASGEPPRFKPATSRHPSAGSTGPWSALGSNGSGDRALNNSVWALAVSGTDLYVGGSFTNAGGVTGANYIAKWDGSTWSKVGHASALNDRVYAIVVDGSNVYVGGYFTDADGIAEADRIARWNGSAWKALGSDGGALNGGVDALAFFGDDLYVGGAFRDAAGISGASGIARWDGSDWHAVGASGMDPNEGGADAFAVKGSVLYVGGFFTNAGGIAEADAIATWNGNAWGALGSDGSGNGALNLGVTSIAIDGSTVYAGGAFTDAAGNPKADYVAKWNGSTWSAVGSNGSGPALDGRVYALALSGHTLYAGGNFHNAGGVAAADFVATWNATSWSALGSNGSGDGALDWYAWALAVSGNRLYVGGSFLDAATNAKADYIAAWSLAPTVTRKPDGRIRLGTGAYVGNNVYNTTGASQTKTGSAAKGKSVTFDISVQNDGSGRDKFKVKATGSAAGSYTVKYLHSSTDITAAVVAGTFTTPSLAPAGTYLITAKVTVKSTAASGSKVTRLVTITSVGNSAKRDAVKLLGKRS